MKIPLITAGVVVLMILGLFLWSKFTTPTDPEVRINPSALTQ